MAIADDELDVDLEGQDPPEGSGPPPDADGAAPQKTAEQIELDDLRAKVGGLEGKTALLDQMGPLLPSIKAALDKWVTPAVMESKPDPAQLRALGESIQKTLLTGTPEEAATLFIQGIKEISKQNVDSEIARVGGPLADRAGDWTLSSYLSMRRDEDPAKEKTHALVVKEIKLTPQQKAWVGAAPAAEVREFLDSKYEQAAGRVLLRSKPKPRDLSGGGGGGGAASGAITAPPGFSAADWDQQVRLNDILHPNDNEKQRTDRLRGLRASLMGEAAS